MAYADPNAPQPPPPSQAVSGSTLAKIVYGLYLAGFSVVGVIIAYVQIGSADPLLQSHYRFQIRTFWISLLYVVVGVALCFVLIGILVLAWVVIWTVWRCVKGILALNDGRPIANPKSWLFG